MAKGYTLTVSVDRSELDKAIKKLQGAFKKFDFGQKGVSAKSQGTVRSLKFLDQIAHNTSEIA